MKPIGSEIYWSMTPADPPAVRAGDAMVHRVVEYTRRGEMFEEALFECGARALRSMAVETADDVDCMGCAIRRTSRASEGEMIECTMRMWAVP